MNATITSATTVGSSLLEMGSLSYSGMVARIISGTGFGQELTIDSNTVDTLTLAGTWSIVPDFTSSFVIAQGTYQFWCDHAFEPRGVYNSQSGRQCCPLIRPRC